MRIRNKRVSSRAQREAETIARRKAAYQAKQAERAANVQTPDFAAMKPANTPKQAGKAGRKRRHGRIVRLHAGAYQDYGVMLELETVTRTAMRRAAVKANTGRNGKAMPDAGWVAPYCFVPDHWDDLEGWHAPYSVLQSEAIPVHRARLDTVARSIYQICFYGNRPGGKPTAKHTVAALQSWVKHGQALMVPSTLPHLQAVREAFTGHDIVIY